MMESFLSWNLNKYKQFFLPWPTGFFFFIFQNLCKNRKRLKSERCVDLKQKPNPVRGFYLQNDIENGGKSLEK